MLALHRPLLVAASACWEGAPQEGPPLEAHRITGLSVFS